MLLLMMQAIQFLYQQNHYLHQFDKQISHQHQAHHLCRQHQAHHLYQVYLQGHLMIQATVALYLQNHRPLLIDRQIYQAALEYQDLHYHLQLFVFLLPP
ncbi:hypothetical protein D3C79_746350 [compost metagenome]